MKELKTSQDTELGGFLFKLSQTFGWDDDLAILRITEEEEIGYEWKEREYCPITAVYSAEGFGYLDCSCMDNVLDAAERIGVSRQLAYDIVAAADSDIDAGYDCTIRQALLRAVGCSGGE